MNAQRSQGSEGIINEPVTCQPTEPGESSALDLEVKVAAFAGPCVPGMQVAVVADRQRHRLQCRLQRRAQAPGDRAFDGERVVTAHDAGLDESAVAVDGSSSLR